MKKKISLAIVSLIMTLICTLQLTMPCFAIERPKQEDVPTAESLYVDTGNAEADKIMNNFIDKAMVLPSMSKYNKGISNVVDGSRRILNADFQKKCGAEYDQYIRLWYDNDLEVYLWAECYMLPCRWAFNEVERYNSWETLYLTAWNANEKGTGCLLNSELNDTEKTDNQDLVDAYNAVLRYIFDYFKENGTIYCFFTGKPWNAIKKNDYSAYWGGEIDNSDVTTMYIPSGYLNETTPTVAVTTISDADTQQTKITEATTPPATTKAKNNVGDIIAKKFASTWLTLSIILALLIAIGVIAIIKKRKGM